MKKHQGTVKYTVFIIMLATAISRFFGFYRELIMGNILGTSNTADAYLVSISVPNILFASIAGAIGTTYIPMYVRQREKFDSRKALNFTNNLINIILIVSLVLAAASVVFARPILSTFFAQGFDEETLNLTVSMSKVVFWIILLLGVDSILIGYLQSNDRFILPAVVGIPNSLIIIGSLFMFDKLGVMGLAYATLFGMFIQFLMLLANSFMSGYRHKLLLKPNDEIIKNIILLALPVFIGSSVGQINALVDRMLASGLEEGSIAALNYAVKLNNFIFGITSAAIATVIYPLLSKLSSNNDRNAYKDLLVKSFNTVTILLLPISVGACILSVPTVTMLFKGGVFDARSVELTSSALFFYALGMIFYGFRDVLGRAFYSMQDTKSPMINGFIAVSINVMLNLILVRFMAHRGLALATSISAVVSTATLTFILRRKNGSIGGKRILETFVKSAVSVSAMGIVVFILYRCFREMFLNGRLLVQIGIYTLIVGIGAVIYFGLLWVLKTDELKWVAGMLINAIGKKRK